jgi:hypothetical protein
MEPEPGTWQTRADALGKLRVVKVDAIPLDRRHRSKVDYSKLRSIAGADTER